MGKSSGLGLAVLSLGWGYLLLAGAEIGAGEKKKDNPSFFKDGKPIELTLKNGKAKYSGEITDKDSSARKHFYKLFTVKLEAKKVYRIEERSDGDKEFDAFLFLEDADGNRLAADDDSGGDLAGLDSRIVFKTKQAGTYRIICTTLPDEQTGKFTLEIGPANAAEIKEAELVDRIQDFASLPPADQKSVTAEVSKRITDAGKKLTVKDAELAFLLTTNMGEADVDAARQTYKLFIKAFESASDKQVAGVARAFEGSLKSLEMVGKEIEISGKTTDGKEFNLKNLKGKVVLVDFWATWCGPCIAEMPNIRKAQEKFGKQGFEIIGVSLDRTDDAIVKFIEAEKLPWKSINVEDSRRLADKYEVDSIPRPILVGPDGRIVSMNARGPQLERLLARLLSGKK